MPELAIVGGGPAGLAAALYAVRQRLDTALISPDLGGRAALRLDLPNTDAHQVIRGTELVERFRNEVAYLPGLHQRGRVRSVSAHGEGFLLETGTGASLESRAVILAVGASQEPSSIPGSDRFLLRGLGTSALSYAHLFFDRTAVVVGSAPRALRSVAHLARSARKVFLIGEKPGTLTQGLSTDPRGALLRGLGNVVILPDAEVVEIRGDDFAREAVLRSVDGNETVIPADGFFLESPVLPNSAMVAGLVDRDEQGFVAVGGRQETSRAGCFAAGDVTAGCAEQILVALGDGARAALSALEYLLSA